MNLSALISTIVIIDDDFIVREVIKKTIQRIAKRNLKIFSSNNGLEGLGLIDLQNPELIILDTTLPKYNGAELLVTLKERNIENVILLHEDFIIPEGLPDSVIKLNKGDLDFIEQLEKAIRTMFRETNIDNQSKFQKRLAKKLILRSNNKDILIHKMNNEGRYFNVFYWLKLFFTELYLSLLLTIYYLTSGGRIKESNLIQKISDRKTYLVRFYPSIFVLIFGFAFLASFLTLSIVYVGGRIRHLSAQQVCPLPAAPTVINNQVTITPDNIDGIVDCSPLDLIVGPTGEVIIESYKTTNTSLDGDWGVTLLVNNLEVQAGGRITADGKGYTVVENEYASGEGASNSGQTGGAGGGHGGAGGQGFEDAQNPSGAGGSSYGNSEQPITLGSAGGNGGNHSASFAQTWSSNTHFTATNTNLTSGIQSPGGGGLELTSNEGTYSSGDQTWTSQAMTVSNTKDIKLENINLDWTLDGTDNIAPKVQLLGSTTGAFAGEETTYPSPSTYFQNGGDISINDASSTSISGVAVNRFKYWKVKIILNTGSNQSDTPRIVSLNLTGNSREIIEATGGAGGGAIRITVNENLTLNGTISANGLPGAANSTTSGGGGAGGSVWIVADSFLGSGSVTANGGSAANVQYQGGGGGGGRVVMVCATSNTFSGTATATQGITESSQDGGVGTVIGPTCKPSTPTILRQFSSNGSIEIAEGGSLSSSSVIVATNMTDVDANEQLILQVEFRALGVDFTGVPTHVQGAASSNPQNCSGSYTTCGRITLTGLSRSTEYHWRARVRDSKGAYSEWASFGSNLESEKDIRLLGDPSTISIVSGNNQTATVGQSISNPMIALVKDSSDYPIPDVNVTWAVTSGGGIIGTSVVKTNTSGESSQTYQVGTVSGSNNQTVTATAAGLSAVTFTHSATAGEATSLSVVTPSVAITSTDFAATITAYDQYGNVDTNFDSNVDLAPVDPNNTATVLGGSLSPTTVTIGAGDNGSKTISTVQYNTQASIKIRFTSGLITTYSNTIAIVDSLGSCPDPDGIIDTGTTVTWDGATYPGGVIDCRGLTIHIKNSGGGVATTLNITSYSANVASPAGAVLLADNLTIDTGNTLSVAGNGFAVNVGPGAGGSAAYGGGHGGNNGNKTPYGSVKEPVTLGSGGSTGAGGGAIKLEIEGTISLDGTISADGANSTTTSTSGGAGGSVYILTDVLNGAGQISANGGTYGGSGGRIAIYRNSGTLPVYTKANVQAYGRQLNGSAGKNAGAGTIYIDEDGDIGGNGDLIVNNNGLAAGSYAGIPYDAASPTVQFNKIYLQEYGHLRVLGSDSTLVVTNEDAVEGDSTSPRLEPEGMLQLPNTFNMSSISIDLIGDITGGNDLVVGNGTVASTLRLYAYNAKRRANHTPNNDIYTNFSNITVKNLSTIYLNSYDGSGTNNNGAGLQDYGVTLDLSGDLNLETGGTITSTGLGHGLNAGPSGGCFPAHGGYAYNGSGTPYGNAEEPVTMGSGGCDKTAAGGHRSSGGLGGGAIKLNVGGSATISGTLSANGTGNTKSIYTQAPSSGSAGSIWLTATTVNGSGLISANGGIGSGSLGSGGGRIAIYELERGNFPITNNDNIQALSGGNSSYGGAGTVYIDEDGQTGGNGDLWINNAGRNTQAAAIVYDASSPIQQFNKIYLKEYGHLRILGLDSTLVIASEEGIEGDSTAPQLEAQGTLSIPDTFIVSGFTLDVIGDIEGGANLTVGNGSLPASFTLYAYNAKRILTQIPNQDVYSNFDNITVKNLSSFTLVSYDGTGTANNAAGLQDYGVTLNLSGSLNIETGGSMKADGLGYAIGAGPSGGCFAAHGGYAYNGSGVPYGSVNTPIAMGSGGCSKSAAGGHLSSGGLGGGAIYLNVDGNINIDGTLSANGTGNTKSIYTQAPTSGAGGSLLIVGQTINGSGIISANGGIGSGSLGSGGGRIAIYENVRGTFPVTNKANIQAFSGGNSNYGGAGTIYLDSDGQFGGNGDLWINNTGRNTQYAAIPYDSENPVQQFNRIYLKEYGALKALGIDSTLLIESEEGIIGDSTAPRIAAEGILSLAETFNIDGVTLDIIGDIEGGNNLTVGDGTKAAAITLYAHTAKRYSSKAPNHDVYSNFENLTLKNNSTMTLISYDGNGTANNAAGLEDYGITFTMNNDLIVESGAIITTAGSGYGTALGQGTGCGPAYGGYGANNGGIPYGSVQEPMHLGSGGCTRSVVGGYTSQGGTGGGAIKFELGGSLELNGSILADGTGGIDNAYVDGASGTGGSLFIIANSVNGSGLISANGGTRSGNPLGGSGGRIAIYETTRGSLPIYNKTNVRAFGGVGSPTGGPGTIYIDSDGELGGNGDLIINNNNVNSALAAVPYDENNPVQEFNKIYLKEYGGLRAMGIDGTLQISSETGIEGDATAPQVEAEGIIALPETFTITGVTLDVVGDIQGGNNLTIGDGTLTSALKLYAHTSKRATLYSPNQDIYNFDSLNVLNASEIEIYSYDGNGSANNASGLQDYGVTINVSGDFNLSSGGNIDGIGKGYAIGAGASGGCSASHGGYSGLGTGTIYGDIYNPVTIGSGGCTKTAGAGVYVSSGGIGGSALKLAVLGDFALNGNVKFDGTSGYKDLADSPTSGAGGSVWIEADMINGSGTVTANGGAGSGINGAGGGRVAIFEKNRGDFPVSNKSNVQAFGGGNTTYGGAGTIYIDADGLPNGVGDLIIENNSRAGRSMDFEGIDYNFRNVVIGPNVTSKVLSTLNEFPSDYDYPVPQEASVTDDTVVLYHLNEVSDASCGEGDICDSSSNARHLLNSGTVYSNGIYSYGRKFDGQGYIEGNQNYNLTDFSISLWLKADGYDKNGIGGNSVLSFNDSSNYSIELVPTGDVTNSTTAEIIVTWNGQRVSTGHIIDLLWHHVVVSYNPGNGSLRVYVDSNLVEDAIIDPDINTSVSVMAIGKEVGDSLRFKGSVDEVAILNKAVGSVEVQALYKGMQASQLERILGRGALFNISGSFTLDTGAKLDAKGTGYPAGQGPGAGSEGSGQAGGAGAGHGGSGGSSENDGINGSATGGTSYGTQRRPFTLGSGGGAAGTGALGGNGGGSIAIKARTGDVNILGTIDVSGEVGRTASPGGGGGSGGSILVEGQTCDISGSLLSNGGNGGDDIYDGGGGGGGRVSVLYTQGPCEVSGTVSYVSGSSSGGQDGQIGTYPSISAIPAVPAFKDQFHSDGSTPIPVGGFTPEQVVTLKSNVSDPSATADNAYDLVAEFEVVGISESFTALNTYKGVVKPSPANSIFAGVFTTPSTEYSGGEALVSEIQIPGLTPGEEYKWRVRVFNQDTQVAGQWTEFGNNGSNQADFTVTNTNELDLEASKTTVDVGEYFSLTARALDIFGQNDPLYEGTVTFSSDTELVDLPSNYEFTTFDAGEHTFTNSVRFLTAGTYSITIEDMDAESLTDTISITVNALPPTEDDEDPVSTPTDDGEDNETPGESNNPPVSSPNGNENSSSNCVENPNSIECVIVEITNVRVEIINDNSVRICFNTNIPTVASIEYGLSADNVYTKSVFGAQTYSTDQCIDISSLEYNVGYIYEINATAQSGRSDDHEGTFSTNPELVVERPSEPALQCITHDANDYSFNASGEVTLRYTTQKESMCTVYYGNDPTDLKYRSVSDISSTQHRSVLSLSVLDGERDLFYRIECGEQENLCTSGSVIPVSKYLEYYRNRINRDQNQLLNLGLATLVTATLLANVGAYPRMITLLFPWLLRRRKKGTWGIVSDDQTKQAIPFAKVYIYDTNGKFVADTVTGFDGKYGFVVDQGAYTIEVKHSEYMNQTAKVEIKRTEDIASKDFYLIKNGNKPQSFKAFMNKIRTKLQKNLYLINQTIALCGFVLSFVAFASTKSALSLAILLFYAIQLVVFALSGLANRRWGYVYDVETKQRIAGVSVRVFNKTEKRQIDVQLSDLKGRFGFRLPEGEYQIGVNSNGYLLSKSTKKKYEVTENAVGQTLINFTLKKNQYLDLVIGMEKDINSYPTSSKFSQ